MTTQPTMPTAGAVQLADGSRYTWAITERQGRHLRLIIDGAAPRTAIPRTAWIETRGTLPAGALEITPPGPGGVWSPADLRALAEILEELEVVSARV